MLGSSGRKQKPVAAWTSIHQPEVEKIQKMLTNMKNSAEMDYPTIAVAVRELGQLGD